MLARGPLKNAPNRASLLAYVVTMHLRKQPIDENMIGRALFPGYIDDAFDDVRVTASNLRASLRQYYANDGADDLVRIDLPRGRRYRPCFSYNPVSTAIKHYLQGQSMLRRTGVWDVLFASSEFERAIHSNPRYAPAHAAKAEQLIRLKLFYEAASPEAPPTGPISEAHSHALTAIRLSPKHWQGHFMLGACFACGWQWKDADRSFAKAFRLNPHETSNHPWYPAYLIAIGRCEEALDIARGRANESPQDVPAQIALGLFLHLTRNFTEANEVLGQALLLDLDNWPALLLRLVNCLSLDSLESARQCLKTLSVNRGIDCSPEEFCPGLLALLEAKKGNRPEVRRTLAEQIRRPAPKPEQLAICYLAAGKKEKAIDLLRVSSKRHNPLFVFLHLWPILDPLRSHADFQELVRSMGLPKIKPAPVRKR